MDEDTIKRSVPQAIIDHMITHGINERPALQKYFNWLDTRSQDFSAQKDDKKIVGSAAWIRAFLHEAVISTSGLCYYTGGCLDWEHIGQKENDKPNAPSIDHDRFQHKIQLTYYLTSVRVNRSKQNMSIIDWIALAKKVEAHLKLS